MVENMKQDFIDGLIQITGQQNVRVDESMAEHTTFRIGGPASVFVTPEEIEAIREVICYCNKEQVPFFLLGQGSNLLVGDKGIDGVVIHLGRNFANCKIEGNRVWAQAGVLLSKLGAMTKEAGLAGFEFAAGIPGTLGGAVTMNAGAYGGEMKDIVTSVTLMDAEGHIFEKSGEEMAFGYRHSIVEEQNYIVLDATLSLKEGERQAIQEKMEELAQARRSKQPLDFPSAGSTFKRPEGYFAGKLIMDAGLRGYAVGGAQVSEKHCGFVVNKGGATASDVVQLMQDVKKRVWEQFQVELEPEVKRIGEF